MRTINIFVLSALILASTTLEAGNGRSTGQPGDGLAIGIGAILVPGVYANPQFSFTASSHSGWGFYLSVATQLLPGNAPVVSLKHWSGEVALLRDLWRRNSLLVGYRYGADYPTDYANEKPYQYHQGWYLGLRLVPVNGLVFHNDHLAVVATYWLTTMKTKEAAVWQYSIKFRPTLAISYNLAF